MPRCHTHYDNLRVARNAPPEVIRAAYKTLSQRYHPDRNPGNPEAARVMAILNASYAVLSDPQQRRLHDLWISQQEKSEAAAADAGAGSEQPCRQAAASTVPSAPRWMASIVPYGWALLFWGLIAGLLVWLAVAERSPPPPGPKPYQSNPPGATRPKVWARPATAPNGQPWPTHAAYVRGYEQLHADGLSSVTIDNSRNDSDVFAKMINLDAESAYPVRTFFIPAGSSFTAEGVRAGNYDVRYRDLSTGALSRTQAFDLEEKPTPDGKQFTRLTMTLYKVADGNMQTYRLSDAEF